MTFNIFQNNNNFYIRYINNTAFVSQQADVATTWIQLGIDIDGEANNDQFGWSTSINDTGDVVAIGAIYNDGIGSDSGHVRVYTWNGSSWTQRGSDIDGESFGDNSGWSISLNSVGDILAIGAPANDGNGLESGHVRVYVWNGSSWNQRGSDINGEAASDQSGFSVSLNDTGDVVAIGAPYNGSGGTNAGHVRIYAWNGSSWVQRGSDIDGEAAGDQLGRSVSLNGAGDIVAIGAPYNDGTANAAGHVRVYAWNGSSWIQRGSDIDGEAASNISGYSLCLNNAGDIVVIGAPYNGDNGSLSGQVRVYVWNGSSWVQRGSDINGEAASDQSGFSVSINNAGDIIAIGAPYNDGNGSDSGHVRIYGWNGSSWIQKGIDLDGEASSNSFGYSVALNSAGNRIIIGGPTNSSSRGHSRIFEFQ